MMPWAEAAPAARIYLYTISLHWIGVKRSATKITIKIKNSARPGGRRRDDTLASTAAVWIGLAPSTSNASKNARKTVANEERYVN